jgi:hypothetical protein
MAKAPATRVNRSPDGAGLMLIMCGGGPPGNAPVAGPDGDGPR